MDPGRDRAAGGLQVVGRRRRLRARGETFVRSRMLLRCGVVDERRDELRSAYLRLGTGELAAAAVFLVVAVSVVVPGVSEEDGRVAVWFALAPLLLMLVQAGAYWLLARSWVMRAPMPRPLATTYRVAGPVTGAALVVGLVGVVSFWPGSVSAQMIAVGVWSFGALEYVNYYVARLAYPVREFPTAIRRWRTPRLVIDMRAARTRG